MFWELAAPTSVSSLPFMASAPPDVPDEASPRIDELHGFADLISQGVSGVGSDLANAERSMADLATGKAVELHDVMINLERARISVQTFVQVRNKLVEAYQDLMRMQL